MNLTRRLCLVCDREQEVLEPELVDQIGLPCRSCGAPTERVAILRTGIVPKSPHAVALGRLGGLKGGPARAEALSSQRRRDIASLAAQARWTRALRHSPRSEASDSHRIDGRCAMSLEEVVRLYYQLFNERRLDEAEQLVDPRASFYYVPTKQRLIGRAGYRALSAAWLTAFENAHIAITPVRQVDEATVRLEFVGRGTHTGDLVLGDALTIPATGRPAALVFHNTVKVQDARIVSVQFDFDAQELRRRLSTDQPG